METGREIAGRVSGAARYSFSPRIFLFAPPRRDSERGPCARYAGSLKFRTFSRKNEELGFGEHRPRRRRSRRREVVLIDDKNREISLPGRNQCNRKIERHSSNVEKKTSSLRCTAAARPRFIVAFGDIRITIDRSGEREPDRSRAKEEKLIDPNDRTVVEFGVIIT